jgi:hypothetical protein
MSQKMLPRSIERIARTVCVKSLPEIPGTDGLCTIRTTNFLARPRILARRQILARPRFLAWPRILTRPRILAQSRIVARPRILARPRNLEIVTNIIEFSATNVLRTYANASKIVSKIDQKNFGLQIFRKLVQRPMKKLTSRNM